MGCAEGYNREVLAVLDILVRSDAKLRQALIHWLKKGLPTAELLCEANHVAGKR